VKCRPPQNRTPLPLESQTCTSLLLFKEIEIIQPSIICTLGTTATQALLLPKAPLSKTRGKLHQAHNIIILPTYHPAYLLRNPEAKKIVWADVQQILPLLNKK
jgi:uracil-DNA glycosylase